MNKKYVSLALFLFSATIAQAADVVTVNAQQTVYYGSACHTVLNLNPINFVAGFAQADQMADEKCHGKAQRISAYQVTPSCFITRVWTSAYLTVGFSARYECL